MTTTTVRVLRDIHSWSSIPRDSEWGAYDYYYWGMTRRRGVRRRTCTMPTSRRRWSSSWSWGVIAAMTMTMTMGADAVTWPAGVTTLDASTGAATAATTVTHDAYAYYGFTVLSAASDVDIVVDVRDGDADLYVLKPCTDPTACNAPSASEYKWRSIHGAGSDEVFISNNDIDAADVGAGKVFRIAVHAWSRHGATFTISAREVAAARALDATQKTALDALFTKCCADTATMCNKRWRTYRTAGTDPCHAAGVRCSTSNKIVELDLSYEAMTCELRAADFTAFGSSLERLKLNGNTGVTLPGETSAFGVIGSLTNLKAIDVSYTSLAINHALDDLCTGGPTATLIEFSAMVTAISGSLPACVLTMPKLQWLNVAGNYLSGTLPDLPAATPMRYMSLGTQTSRTKITGSIPASYASSPTLEYLYLNDLALSGSIPDSFANSNLHYISFKANALSGVIPSSLGSEPYLISIDLSYNELSGAVPVGLYDHTIRQVVNLSNNQLTKLSVTSVQATPGASLEYLNAANNKIKEQGVPETLPTLTGLKVLLLFQNQLYGTMLKAGTTPVWKLYYFDASFNSLSGDVPDAAHWGHIFDGSVGYWQNSATAIPNRFDLSNNSFTGAPMWLQNYTSVANLKAYFMNNPVACPLPTSLVGHDSLAINCNYGENNGSPESDEDAIYSANSSSTVATPAKKGKGGGSSLNSGVLAIILVSLACAISTGVGVGVWMYRKRANRRAMAFHPFQGVEMPDDAFRPFRGVEMSENIASV